MVLLLVELLLSLFSELKLCPRALSLAALAQDSSLLWVIQQLAGLIPDMVRGNVEFRSNDAPSGVGSWSGGSAPCTFTSVSGHGAHSRVGRRRHVQAYRRVLTY